MSKPNPDLLKEIQLFEKDCSSADGLEGWGIILNFVKRNFLKKRTKPSEKFTNPQSSTREAFLVDVEKKFLTSAYRTLSAEDKLILEVMPANGGASFRVKKIKYGNHNAMWEVMSAHLYALTGLSCPDVRLMKTRDVNESGIPQLCVASPIVSGYQDLGDFLIGDAARFITQSNFEKWKEQKSIIEAINLRAQSGGIVARNKLDRLKAMEKIYDMLPDYFHAEIEKSYVASKFIANWDFANFNLANIGCKFLLDGEGKIVSFESVFVDFGNSGVIGFGGKYKEASFAKANAEAKPRSDSEVDYDPALKFNETEKIFILERLAKESIIEDWESLGRNDELFRGVIGAIGLDLAEEHVDQAQVGLVRSILYKDAHHILRNEADIKMPRTAGLLSISDIPRNIPFGFLLRDSVERKTKKFIESGKYFFCDSEIEMAFRLSLIPDEAIELVIKKWNLSEKYPQIFAMPLGLDDSHDYSTKGLAQIFQKRKKDLMDLMPQEVITQWVAKNRIKAIQAQMDVELAVAQRAGELSIATESPLDRSLDNVERDDALLVKAKLIKYEISIFRSPIKSGEEFGQKRENLQKLITENTSLQIDLLKEQIGFLQKELEQEELQMVVNFLQDNVEKWRDHFHLEPTCNPFDLVKISEIYHAEHKKYKRFEGPRFVSSEENRANNQVIYEENSFIYERFMNILEKLILPSRVVHRGSDPTLALPLVTTQNGQQQPST